MKLQSVTPENVLYCPLQSADAETRKRHDVKNYTLKKKKNLFVWSIHHTSPGCSRNDNVLERVRKYKPVIWIIVRTGVCTVIENESTPFYVFPPFSMLNI